MQDRTATVSIAPHPGDNVHKDALPMPGRLPVGATLATFDMYDPRDGMTLAREAVARLEADGQPAMIVKDRQAERINVMPLTAPPVPTQIHNAVDAYDFANRLLQIPALTALLGDEHALADAEGCVLWVTRLADGTVAGLLDTGTGEAAFIADTHDFAEAAGWTQKNQVRLTGHVVNVAGLRVLDLRRDGIAAALQADIGPRAASTLADTAPRPAPMPGRLPVSYSTDLGPVDVDLAKARAGVMADADVIVTSIHPTHAGRAGGLVTAPEGDQSAIVTFDRDAYTRLQPLLVKGAHLRVRGVVTGVGDQRVLDVRNARAVNV